MANAMVPAQSGRRARSVERDTKPSNSSPRAVLTPQEALLEALASGRVGEVVVRRDEHVGRIYVSEGRIAWAHIADGRARLCEIVRGAGVKLDEDTETAVIEEARQRRAHFTDILVQWGYLDEARARECVRELVAEQLGRILALPDAAALFLPRAHGPAARVSFALAEVLTSTSVPAEVPAIPSRRPAIHECPWHACAVQAAGLEGACGAVVLDRGSGAVLDGVGDAIADEIAQSLLAAVAALGAGAEDVIAVRCEAAFLACALDPSSVLVVGFLLDRTNLALARRALRGLIELRDAAPGGARDETTTRNLEENVL